MGMMESFSALLRAVDALRRRSLVFQIVRRRARHCLFGQFLIATSQDGSAVFRTRALSFWLNPMRLYIEDDYTV